MIDLNFKLERSFPPKRKVSTLQHGNIECYDIGDHFIFNTYLVDKMNMPDTRAPKLGRAVSDLHHAVAMCDDVHSDKLAKLTVGELLNLFGEAEELRTGFSRSHPPKPGLVRVFFGPGSGSYYALARKRTQKNAKNE